MPKSRADDRPTLLLDVMDTLVVDPAYDVVLSFFEMQRTDFFALKSKTAYDAFERGAIDEEAFRRSYFIDGRDFDLDALKARLCEGYRWVHGIPALLDDLKAAGYPMFALSNYSVWSELIEDKLELSRWVDWRFVSHKTGHRKPEARAYLNAAQSLAVSPQQCLFVDDRDKNVEGARAVGMRAVRFHNAAQLRAELL